MRNLEQFVEVLRGFFWSVSVAAVVISSLSWAVVENMHNRYLQEKLDRINHELPVR